MSGYIMRMKDIESLLLKFHDGISSLEEETLLTGLISDGETGAFDEYCRNLWMRQNEDMPSDAKERILSQLNSKIEAREKELKKKQWIGRFKRIAKIAAVAASLLVTIHIGWLIASDQKPETFYIVAERGQKSSITLPDGSRVWLNSASTISYTSNYNSKERNVTLQGEAYFEVAKNPEIPFIVHSQNLSVEALGTKFNVKAYVEDDCIITTLVEGRVKATAGDECQMLFPEQESSFDKRTGVMTKSRVKDTSHMIPWMRNEILFRNSSLSEISALLERMYNVTVLFDDNDIGSLTYTGLVRNNSLQNVLELIATTSPVDYRMSADTVKFSKND